jgi:hypothetical protein
MKQNTYNSRSRRFFSSRSSKLAESSALPDVVLELTLVGVGGVVSFSELLLFVILRLRLLILVPLSDLNRGVFL